MFVTTNELILLRYQVYAFLRLLQFLLNVLFLAPESHSGNHPAFCHHVPWGSSWLRHFLRLSLLMTLTAGGALGGHLIERPSVWVCLLFPRVLLTGPLWVPWRLLRQVLTLGPSLSNLTHVCVDLSSFLWDIEWSLQKKFNWNPMGLQFLHRSSPGEWTALQH